MGVPYAEVPGAGYSQNGETLSAQVNPPFGRILVRDCYYMSLLLLEILLDESLSLLKGPNNVNSIYCLLDVTHQRGSAIRLQSLYLSR